MSEWLLTAWLSVFKRDVSGIDGGDSRRSLL